MAPSRKTKREQIMELRNHTVVHDAQQNSDKFLGVSSLQRSLGDVKKNMDKLQKFPYMGPPLLYSLPLELFELVIGNMSLDSLLALSQTGQAMRYNPAIERVLFTEPMSQRDFPMTVVEMETERLLRMRAQRPWCGFAEEMQDDEGCYDSFLSLQGRKGTRNPNYLTATTCRAIGQKLNTRTGAYVKRLAIPNWLTVADIEPYAKYCQSIEHLDVATFMHAIDSDEPEPDIQHYNYSWAHNFNLRWDQLLDDNCSDLFANVRSMKIKYSGPQDPDDLLNLTDLLTHAKQLECLHIYWPAASERQFKSPNIAYKLLDILATRTSKHLKEVCFDDMLLTVRSPRLYFAALGEALPRLERIVVSIDKDIQRLALGISDGLKQNSFAMPQGRELNLVLDTPTSVWGYLRMLKALSEDPQFTATLKPLNDDQTYDINPRAFFSTVTIKVSRDANEMDRILDDMARNLDKDARSVLEFLKWLQQTLHFSPTFNWNDQMHSIPETTQQALYEMSQPSRTSHLDLCREFFQQFKDAGIPVKLLLSTKQSHRTEPLASDYGSFFALPFRCANWKRLAGAEQCDGETHFRKSGPWQWYLHEVGDLVDQLTVRWGNEFLRKPAADAWNPVIDEPETCEHRLTFDDRPIQKRVNEEREKMEALWNGLADWFPNLQRLDLHIPAEVYVGDQRMLDLLPGSWRLEIRKSMVVKDYRKGGDVVPYGDVTFLDRTFVRNDTPSLYYYASP